MTTRLLNFLVCVLCIGTVDAGNISVVDEEKDTSQNFTDFELGSWYISRGEAGSYLCRAVNTVGDVTYNRSEIMLNVPVWYSLDDSKHVPLQPSFGRFPARTECHNEAYIYSGKSVTSEITTLTISHCNLSELWNNAFSEFTKLEVLDLSYNNLKEIPAMTFHNLTNLESLDLSYNDIATLDLSNFDLFSLPLSVSYINFSRNYLQRVTCSFFQKDWMIEPNASFLNSFWTLDVSNNNISYISPLCEYVIETYYKNVTININGNPVNCNCSVKHNSSSGENVTDLHDCTCANRDNVDPGPNYTFTSIELLAVATLLISFPVLVSVGFLYWKSKKGSKLSTDIKCKGSICTNVIRCNKEDPPTSKTFIYVYIVASLKDSDLVDQFVEELETKRNVPVIFKERDEIPGYFKFELFRQWLSSSKRTVFLINSAFFNEPDCVHILNQAKAIELMQGRVIIVIIKLTESIHPKEEMLVNDLSVRSICLDYTPTREFWDKLTCIIHDTETHVHLLNDA